MKRYVYYINKSTVYHNYKSYNYSYRSARSDVRKVIMIIMTTVAQFSSLIFLLSLALTSPANCWTNGTTVEYWVRPDTMSECSHFIPQHQCVTITDLVTNSTDTRINGGRSINVFFIAGTHVPKMDGWIIIVGNPQVSANFTAISDGQNQHTKYKHI